jgi:hypothetical protein
MAINSETEAGLGKSQNMSAYLWQISVDQEELRGNRGLKWSRMGVSGYHLTIKAKITFMSIHINIYRPKLSALYQRDGMVQRLWQKWSRF